jgi:Zn-dependent peptidase ImmA (M78 family)
MATYKTDERLEELVRKFLGRIGLEDQVRPDLMTVIVKIRHVDTRFKYLRVPDDELPTSEAEWDSINMLMRMRESVFCSMNRGDPRARMTVAHELSHYVLGHEGILNRKPGISTSDIRIASVRHEESEARRMASIILAPEHLVPDPTTAEEIASKFGLSTEASIYRYDEVSGIRRRRRGDQRPLPQSIIDYLREAKRRGHAVRTDVDDRKD